MNMQSLETGAQPEQGRTWVMSAVPQAAWLVASYALGVARRAGWMAAEGVRQGMPGVAKPQGMMSERNDGPPDLDELWRDLNRKLSNIFAGRNGGGDNGPGGSMTPDPTGAGIGIGLVLGLVAVIWLGSGFFIVQEGQQAVIMTFGSYSHKVDAGFQWRAPFPIQSHEVVNLTQLRSIDVGSNSVMQATGLRDSSMLTRDENI